MKNDMSRRDLSLALTLALSWQIFPSIAMAQAQTSSQSNSEEIVGLRAILVRETRSENGVEMWELTFDAESAARLREFSRRSVGKAVAIYSDGRKLSAPVMREPITGDGLQISGKPFETESRNKLRLGAPLVLDFRIE
jgi:preprotein translocase subunit SecD